MAFIVFEGLDGSGKSTLMDRFGEHLSSHGLSYLKTREPGGSELGEKIRDLLLHVEKDPPCPRAEILLYEAARAQHVDLKIKPALKARQWVLSDRYYASTVAFQAGGRTLDISDVNQLNQFAISGVEPDLWVLLDLSVEEAQKRMAGRALDRMEQEKIDFHERVRKSYLDLASEDPDRWLVLDSQKSPEVLFEELKSEVNKRGFLKGGSLK